ncbi:hypothetical protein GH714_006100 [Hevea brasiliensis]|uniref:NmrA-like domain-containing protein n=1 Tax=Hevea brasiliensis TaxID=3981 RepID=A0A6A6M9Q9_HEVBR|nr:hypothetical protein GH714_006100 [Hevea brasiliensis]
MANKSKILIGGTGYFGKFVVEASAKAGHPTFALVRESTVSDPAKGKLIENFKNLGVTILHGDICDHQSLVKAIKQVDVVVSTVGALQLADQTNIISAIKEAGNVKRFFPSEFGNDVDHVHAVEPAKSLHPPILLKSGGSKVTILGDGNVKAIFNKEDDIATYTIKAVDDPRTLNKTLLIMPPNNIYTSNELVALWEKKVGKAWRKVMFQKSSFLRISKGDQTNFEIDPSWGVEASELYPDVKYSTVDEMLDQLV